jgi:small nuclear ribonucleoprotein (snRNP)-like protein
MENKVVVHLKDGMIHKGVTQDFDEMKESFYLLPAEGGGVPLRITLEDMKAMFYVRDYMGNRKFNSSRSHLDDPETSKKVVLTFRDGEELWGTRSDLSEDGSGFFFCPTDEEDNNIRIFVVRSSLEEMKLIE